MSSSHPIIKEATNGNVSKVMEYLKQGSDPNTISLGGDSILALSAYANNSKKAPANHVNLVLELLNAGADPNLTGRTGKATLHATNDPTIAHHLLSAGANPNLASSSSGETPLMDAAKRGNVGVIYQLLKNGANPNLTNSKGETALDLSKDECIKNILESAIIQ